MESTSGGGGGGGLHKLFQEAKAQQTPGGSGEVTAVLSDKGFTMFLGWLHCRAFSFHTKKPESAGFFSPVSKH